MKLSDQVKKLRRAVLFLGPLAEEIIGAYPPEQREHIKGKMRQIKTLVRETAPKRKVKP